ARTICSALESRGLPCWIASRDVGPGENFMEAIVRAIRTAKVMVLVFSENANNSDDIKREIVLAGNAKVTVIPVRVEDVVPGDAFAYQFATRQWIDLFDDWEGQIERLAKWIIHIVAAETAGAATSKVEAKAELPNPTTDTPMIDADRRRKEAKAKQRAEEEAQRRKDEAEQADKERQRAEKEERRRTQAQREAEEAERRAEEERARKEAERAQQKRRAEEERVEQERQARELEAKRNPGGIDLQQALRRTLHEHWLMFLIEGIILVILGALAIVLPVVATIAVTILIGWLFLISGIVGLFTTFMARHAPGFWWSLVSAVIAIVAGILLLGWPISGVISLTLLLIVFFVMEGVASIMYALEHKKELTGRWAW